MAGEDHAVVLNAVAALDKGEDKVTDLRNDGDNETESGKDPVCGEVIVPENAEDISVKNASENAEDDTADRALDCLLGANGGDKLVATEETTAEVSEGISNPGGDENEEIEGASNVKAVLVVKVSELNDGDKIEFIAGYYDYSGNYQASYVLDGSIEFKGNLYFGDVSIADYKTKSTYQFRDIYQQNYWTTPME